ncbi:lipopolysaccharide biosynthesis protein [Pontibacterium sp.]|uniref:lipopolysaccharide biosynthesis protein n=1 Tax=Pontibacterium sp. TaxID=2036026 RepID=UPI0035658F09
MLSKFAAPALITRIATLISGSAGANLIVLLATPVLSRLYSPDSFGMLALFVSISAVMGTVMCLRYEQAVYLPEQHETAHKLALGATSIALVLTLLFTLACITWMHLELSSLLGSYTILLPLVGLGLALYNLMSNWAVRMEKVSDVAKTRLYRASAQVTSQLFFAMIGMLQIGLIIGDLIGRFAGITNIFRKFSRLENSANNSQPRLKNTYNALREYWRFPLISTPTALLNVAVMQSPSILLATLYSPTAAGFYFMAQRIIAAPMALMGQSVAQGYTAELASRFNQNTYDAASLFFRSAGWLLIIGAPMLLIIGLLAPELMPKLLGGDWHTAGEYILILTPFFIGQFVMSPLSTTLNVIHKQHWLFLWDLVRLACVIPSFVVAVYAGWSAEMSLLLFSCLMAGSYAVLFILISLTLKLVHKDENFRSP